MCRIHKMIVIFMTNIKSGQNRDQGPHCRSKAWINAKQINKWKMENSQSIPNTKKLYILTAHTLYFYSLSPIARVKLKSFYVACKII